MPSWGGNLMTLGMRDRFPNLMDWLAVHNVNAMVIIIIMLLVSLLSMASALLIILLERTSMIGILKALGMNNGSLRRLFVMRSAFIIGRGMLWGNVAGIALCLIQYYTHAVKLDEAGYFLSSVPISLGFWWWLILNVCTFALLILLLVMPASAVSRVQPDVTMRYN
jgi:lipoprotein-releasing system permease protein